jgi:hypothetical protein
MGDAVQQRQNEARWRHGRGDRIDRHVEIVRLAGQQDGIVDRGDLGGQDRLDRQGRVAERAFDPQPIFD